jgi:acyl-coenzyme A thioesterase PaaI-like protein
MNAVPDLSTLPGLEQLRAIFAGRTGYEGIVKTFDLHPVSAEEGFVVFEGFPTRAVYNPLGSVHGGYAATMLDTVWPARCTRGCWPDRATPRSS